MWDFGGLGIEGMPIGRGPGGAWLVFRRALDSPPEPGAVLLSAGEACSALAWLFAGRFLRARLMSYSHAAQSFCGLCKLRLRGWDPARLSVHGAQNEWP